LWPPISNDHKFQEDGVGMWKGSTTSVELSIMIDMQFWGSTKAGVLILDKSSDEGEEQGNVLDFSNMFD
jgi:hypothetical protein